jgi:hypothetical protein
MKQLRSIRRALTGVFFTLFVMMTLNNIVFRHAHRLADGRIITHAHPFKPVGDSPVQPHSHTATELFWLDMLTHGGFVATVAVAVAVAVIVSPLLLMRIERYHLPLRVSPFVYFSRRGPPSFVYLY